MKKNWNTTHGRFRINADNDSIEQLRSDGWFPVEFVIRENILTYEHDYIKKTLYHHDWSKKNFDLYQELSQGKNYFIKVLDWLSPRQYTMEKIEIISDVRTVLLSNEHQLTRHQLEDIYCIFNQYYLDCINFSRNRLDGEYFMHQDYQLQNVVMTKDYQVKVIDADSFQIRKEFMDWTYFDSLQIIIFLINEKIKKL